MLEKNCLIFWVPNFLRLKDVNDVKNSLYYGGLGNTNQNQNEKYTSRKKILRYSHKLFYISFYISKYYFPKMFETSFNQNYLKKKHFFNEFTQTPPPP